jgi:hypothetical protein
MRTRVGTVALVAVTVSLLTGCGGSGGSSSSSTQPTGSAPAANGGAAGGSRGPGAETPGSGKPAQLPNGMIARVNDTPITTASYQHWLGIAAPPSVKPLITNPSDYSACAAAVKSREARSQQLMRTREEQLAKLHKGHSQLLPARSHSRTTDAQRKQQCEELFKEVKHEALSTLIQRLWTQAQASELGVKASDSEVMQRLKSRKEEQARIAKNRSSTEGLFASEMPHYSEADMAETIKGQLLETQVYKTIRERFAKVASVSQGKLEKYFNEHKQIYARPEQRSVVIAQTKSQSVAEAIVKEHSSSGLTGAASKHSARAMPNVLGCEHSSVPGIRLSSLYSAVCSAKSNTISGPIKMASTYYLVEVKSITPASQPSFDQAKERIKQLLVSESQGQAIERYNQEIRAKLRAHTECAAGYVVELCSEYRPPAPASRARR